MNLKKTHHSILVSKFLTWRSVFETSIKMVSVPLLGWWGDRWGYKWPLIFSLTALGLESASLLVNSLFQSWPLEAILFGSVFFGISGGPHGLLMLSFSFMAQRTTTERRTLKIGIFGWVSITLGSPIGLAIASPLFNSVGYNGIFGISVLPLCLSSSLRPCQIVAENYLHLSEEEEEEKRRRKRYCNDCGVDRLSDAFYTTFKSRPEKKRRFILICILAMLLDSFVIWGTSNTI
ncbi:hypothetical protein Avbf_15931 [Armadillidium vulgare]|nr:hypothetical protein Avbf_15931 [Armadillidium vulgare]